MPVPRLFLAFLASLLLHAALISGYAMPRHRPVDKPLGVPPRLTPAMIDATLRTNTPIPAEPLLKDTLSEAEAAAPVSRAPIAPAPTAVKPGQAPPAAVTHAARRKLAQHVYYPAEAITAGMEGEVRLLISLAADGAVLDAQIARSSGHAILDRAAVRAAFAMGNLPGMERTEVILPVEFRLQP